MYVKLDSFKFPAINNKLQKKTFSTFMYFLCHLLAYSDFSLNQFSFYSRHFIKTPTDDDIIAKSPNIKFTMKTSMLVHSTYQEMELFKSKLKNIENALIRFFYTQPKVHSGVY